MRGQALDGAGKARSFGHVDEQVVDRGNSDPEGEGWYFKLTLSDAGELDGLMDEAAYKSFLEELD